MTMYCYHAATSFQHPLLLSIVQHQLNSLPRCTCVVYPMQKLLQRIQYHHHLQTLHDSLCSLCVTWSLCFVVFDAVTMILASHVSVQHLVAAARCSVDVT